MFRRIDDFEKSWAADSEATLKILRTLTDASLGQSVAPGGRTLGRLAWHLTCTLGEMPGHVGLKVDSPAAGLGPAGIRRGDRGGLRDSLALAAAADQGLGRRHAGRRGRHCTASAGRAASRCTPCSSTRSTTAGR